MIDNKEIEAKEIQALMLEAPDQLMLALGMQAQLLEPPSSLLAQLRSGAYTLENVAVLGDERKTSEPLEKAGKTFLKNWATGLGKAICENKALQDEERKLGLGLENTQMLVASVVTAIAAAEPHLATFSGLLTVIGVMVARSGVGAFCKTLKDL